MHFLNKIKFILFFMSFCFLGFSQTNYDDLFKEAESKEQNKEENKNQTNYNLDLPKFKFGINGEGQFEFHIPVTKDHLDFYGDVKAPRFDNDIGFKINYGTLSVVSEWAFKLKMNEFGNVEEMLSIRPLDNYIKWSLWRFTFKTGFQYYSWGCADELNPTDNLNPRDYTLGLDSEKLSVLSMSVGFFPIDLISLEVVYVPFEQGDIFPVDFKDEIPKEFFYGQRLVSAPPPYIFDFVKNGKNADYENLKFDPSSFVLGGKINFTTQYADFSFSYLYDIDQYFTPVINLIKDNIENTPNYMFRIKSVELVRKRLHRIGTDFKTNIKKAGLWLEMCYTISEDYLMDSYKLRNHNFSWVAGLDMNYGPGNDFYFNVQFLGEYNPLFDTDFYKKYEDGKPDSDHVDDEDYMEEYYYSALTNGLGAVREGLVLGIACEFEWSLLKSLLTPSISAAYMLPLIYDYDHELRYGGLVLNPEFDIMPIDSFHIIIGANLFYSWHKVKHESLDIDYDDRIGSFYYHNNIYLMVKYKWGFDWEK